jgi:hypothetical protein
MLGVGRSEVAVAAEVRHFPAITSDFAGPKARLTPTYTTSVSENRAMCQSASPNWAAIMVNRLK